MKIEKSEREDQLRCINEASGMLVGLITKIPDGRWRIEMYMLVDGVASTRDEAIAFAKGCNAVYTLFKPERPISAELSPIMGPAGTRAPQRRGLQNG